MNLKGILEAVLLAVTIPATAIETSVFEFRDGAGFAPKGYGLIRNWYQAGGRLTCRCSVYGGITHLGYYGAEGDFALQTGEDSAAFTRTFEPQVLIDGRAYRLPFTNTRHYTFGYASECTVEGVKLAHELVLDGHALYRRIRVLDNPAKRQVRGRIHHTAYARNFFHDHAKGLISAIYVHRGERAEVVTNRVEIGCLTGKVEFPINRLKVRPECAHPEFPDGSREQRKRFFVDTLEPSDEFVFYLDLDANPSDPPKAEAIDRAFADQRARYAESAKIVTGDRLIGDFLTWGAAWADALDVDGVGAVRASQTYWVWPWDEMFAADVLVPLGNGETVRKMLLHLRDHASPETFLPGCYDARFTSNLAESAVDWVGNDRKAKGFSAWNLLYVHLLCRYWLYTGDEETKSACLPFVRAMMHAFRSRIDRPHTNLPYGHFRPDWPCVLDWKPRERCLADAAIYYQALRTYSLLSGEDLSAEADAVKAEVERLFYWRQEALWMDTVGEPSGLPKEDPICLASGPWEMGAFAREFVPDEARRIAESMQRRFHRGNYVFLLAPNDRGYFGDGNQLGSCCPPENVYYWDVMNRAQRGEALDEFRRLIRPHAEILTYPEAQTADVENADPRICSDNTGIKQFFTIKAWLTDVFNLRLGWDADREGIRLHPMSDGVSFALESLHLRGARLTVRMSGKGTAADARYSLDGKRLPSALVPWWGLEPGKSHVLEIDFDGKNVRGKVR